MVKAIDILLSSKDDPDLTEEAVRMHMECTHCQGCGGAVYYPESPCPECGFTFADSLGVENIVSIIEAIREAEEEFLK